MSFRVYDFFCKPPVVNQEDAHNKLNDKSFFLKQLSFSAVRAINSFLSLLF